MIRQAVRGLVAVLALALVLSGAVGQQPPTPDKFVVRDKKDGTNKTDEGTAKFAAAGLQIIGEGNKVLATVSPESIVKYTPGELVGVDRATVLALIGSEDKKSKADYEKAKLGYAELQRK